MASFLRAGGKRDATVSTRSPCGSMRQHPPPSSMRSLARLSSDLIDEGGGCCLIDPHGDLVETVASRFPPARRNDAIYFDPSDLSYSIGYNPLLHTDRDSRPLV